jgi:hypothetical protein
MTKEQAIDIATVFVAQKNLATESALPHPYCWVVSPPVEHEEGWYFDYTFDHRFGRLADEPLLIGGAPGYLVSKSTQQIRPISWGELPELPMQDSLRRQAAQQAERLLSAGLTLLNLRRHLRLPLAKLQAFKAQLTENSKAEQRALLIAQLYQQAREEYKPGKDQDIDLV